MEESMYDGVLHMFNGHLIPTGWLGKSGYFFYSGKTLYPRY